MGVAPSLACEQALCLGSSPLYQRPVHRLLQGSQLQQDVRQESLYSLYTCQSRVKIALEFGSFVSKRHSSKAWMLFSFLRHFLILLSCSFNKCSISKENTDTIERAVIEFTQIQPLKSSHKTERKKVIITS